MEEKRLGESAFAFVNRWINKWDKAPLWLLGFFFLAGSLLPCLILGEGSVFPVHDQLDETLFVYVLNGKYMGTGTEIFPELLDGVNVSGMQPSAVLFVPLYRLLPVFAAFLVQWAVVLASAYFGMYACVKEICGSSILAAVAAGWFCMLPSPPVYGLSVTGIPMLLCCVLWLFRKKHRILSFALILLFGLTTHLVLTGYAALALWGLALAWEEIRHRGRKRQGRWLPWIGMGWLAGIYIFVNRSLFWELILKNGSYVSHREELVNQAMPFWKTVGSVFLDSAQHAESFHRYFILPILILLAVGGFRCRRAEDAMRRRYRAALGGMAALVLIAVFYGICKWQPVVDWKNSVSGFPRYFQAERFYWLYPAGWCLELILCFSLWWDFPYGGKGKWQGRLNASLVKLLVLAVIFLPAWKQLKEETYLFLNINQMNNGSEVTGYISWESYYAEDLMQELEDAIGRDMASYRVANLGISPAPALMHGFYTVDGYSNNYPLEYKHRFRRVIAAELGKNEAVRQYFDQWGSRCYLFNSASGTSWMLGKRQQVIYEDLEFDMDALRDLGCEYVFSCGLIRNAEELGAECLGYFETDSSYWGIWLYQL